MTSTEDLRERIRSAVGEAVGSGEGLDDVESELRDALDRIETYREAVSDE